MKKNRQNFKMIFVMTFLLLVTSWLAVNDARSASQTGDVSLFTYAGSDREQKLLEGAKKEGNLTWYTSLAGQIVNNMVKAFEAKYPFIKVQVYRAAEAAIVQRMEQESKAGKNIVDVIETPIGAVLTLQADGLITPYFSPSIAHLPDDFQIKATGNTIWAGADRVSYIGFSYNKKEFPASAVPEKLKDLLNPELKNKLGIVSSTTGVRWVGSVLNSLGDKEGRKFLAELKKQNVKVYSISGGALMGLISQGEIASSMTIFGEHAAQAKEKGVPVEWIPIEGTVVNVGEVVVAKQALNRHAAMLFVDFILGEDGGKVLKDNKYNPAYEAGKASFKAWTPEQGKTAREYEEGFNKWKQLLQSTFR